MSRRNSSYRSCVHCGDAATVWRGGVLLCHECYRELRYGEIPPASHITAGKAAGSAKQSEGGADAGEE